MNFHEDSFYLEKAMRNYQLARKVTTRFVSSIFNEKPISILLLDKVRALKSWLAQYFQISRKMNNKIAFKYENFVKSILEK